MDGSHQTTPVLGVATGISHVRIGKKIPLNVKQILIFSLLFFPGLLCRDGGCGMRFYSFYSDLKCTFFFADSWFKCCLLSDEKCQNRKFSGGEWGFF